MGERHAGLVFYDNSDFNIAKSKKSEQYIHENFDEHFARRCESHWRETWHHTGTRTEPPIFLETPHPLHQCKEIRKSETYLDFTLLVLFFYQTST